MQGILSCSGHLSRVLSCTQLAFTPSISATSSAVINFKSIFPFVWKIDCLPVIVWLAGALHAQQGWRHFFFCALAHRALAAFRADSLRCFGVIEAARALPPLRPSSCAALFAIFLLSYLFVCVPLRTTGRYRIPASPSTAILLKMRGL